MVAKQQFKVFLSKHNWQLVCIIYESSLATSPSPPAGQAGARRSRRAEGGEGLANIALDHVSLECQLHVPVNR